MPRPHIHIASIDDPRLEVYRDVRDRDLAGRHGVFMLEGHVVLDAALTRGPVALRSVLVSDRRVAAETALLDRVPEAVPVYVLPEAMMFDLVGFPIHRGLLAAGVRPVAPDAAGLLASLRGHPHATVLVLEGLTNHDNVGACFRNAAAFGADAVILDGACCDPFYRKAIRVSAGHVLSVPWAREATMSSVMDALEAEGYLSLALALAPDAGALDDRWRPAPRLALLLGTEGAGLSPAIQARASARVVIPMASGVDSLNVSVAGAVGLFATRWKE